MRRRTFTLALGGLLASAGARAAEGEKFTVAVGQRGAWDTSVCEFGGRAGIFARNGLELNLLFTDGGSDTQTVVISGACDIGVGGGTVAVLAAFSRGAPLRIISSNFTGVSDTFWYALADSGIAGFEDAGGKTVAFSTVGGMSNIIAQALVNRAGVKAKLVATGNPTATLTQVLSRQIDIGYALPPFAFREIESGTLRNIGNGEVFPELQTQTVRCLITNETVLSTRLPALRRFMGAYRETLDWMYADPRAIEWYAELNNVPVELARRIREKHYPRPTTRLGRPQNVELAMQQAVETRRMREPLSAAQLDRLLTIIDPAAG